MGNGYGLASMFLKQALRRPGCPICRCCLDHETRYLRFLLWENVNDLETRVQIASSLGFCGRHARQMLEMEREGWGSLLGNSIIYEDLVNMILTRVRATRLLVTENPKGRNGIQRLRQRLASWLAPQDRRRERLLIPTGDCRVCEVGWQTARHYVDTLTEMLAETAFQEMYVHSGGVCLSHLRLAIQVTMPGPGLDYLLDQTEERLGALRSNLQEYHRKQAYQYRDETVTEQEQEAAEGAMAFLSSTDLLASAVDARM